MCAWPYFEHVFDAVTKLVPYPCSVPTKLLIQMLHMLQQQKKRAAPDSAAVALPHNIPYLEHVLACSKCHAAFLCFVAITRKVLCPCSSAYLEHVLEGGVALVHLVAAEPDDERVHREGGELGVAHERAGQVAALVDGAVGVVQVAAVQALDLRSDRSNGDGS